MIKNLPDTFSYSTAPGRAGQFQTSADFWAHQIVTAYQGPKETDHDPDKIYHWIHPEDNKTGEPALLGQTIPPDHTGYDNVSVIFLETIRDFAAWTVFFQILQEVDLVQAVDAEQVTVVHETGHAFGLGHPPTGIMQPGADDPALAFRAEDLAIIRNNSVIGNP